MSKKSVLRFTVKELNTLIQDEKARVVLQRSIRKLPLQPYCLSDLQGAIHEVLDANLAKFDNELKGILLSYKNIKIVKDIANVLYDDSRLYLTIQADFYLFMPEVGCVLRGIVNKRSADHIGCLVHKAFNVSIPRPECETDGDWQGYYVEIGQEVTFRVESLDLTGSLPYMLGCLLDVESLSSPTNKIFAEEKATKKEEIFSAINKFNGLLVKHEDSFADVPTLEHKKKKKHKKNEDLESKANVQDSMFLKHEKYDSILEKDDQEHDEDGSVLKTPKKKKRKNTDQIAPIKQEDQTYGIDDQQEEEQHQFEEQILHSGKQINSSYHLAASDHLNSATSLKKKKRKHSEAFYDNYNDDDEENYKFFCARNESEKPKKKKSKKEKHLIEMPNADELVEEDVSVDTSQELASQDKKRKKKKKRDVKEEISKDFEGEADFNTTDDFDCLKAQDKPLTTSPYINNTPEKLITEMQFSKEHFKKLSKKVKPLESTEHKTSTPFEQKTKKEKSFSDNVSRSQFSVTEAVSHSDFKQSTLLESMDHFSLMPSPILKDKYSKREKESSPSVQSDSVPGKVKKLKKEKRLSSSQPNPVTSISEGYQHSGSHHILHQPESNLPRSDTENLTRGETTYRRSSDTSLTNVQETEHHLIKNSLESPVKSKLKSSKKESCLSVKKKDSIGSDVKRTMKKHSNNGGDNDAADDHGNNSYNQIVARCEVSGKAQVSDRLVEQKSDIKRQSSITRKSSTPPMNATSSLMLGTNTSEDDTSEEENALKGIPKLSRTPSSGSSSKCSQVNARNLSPSQASRSLDRACSSDSGLSLSATSAEKDSNNFTSKDSKRDADSIYSTESPKGGRPVKEKGKLLPKTPNKKKIADADQGSNHLTTKHRIKKEKESPISQPSRHKIDSTSPLRENGSLEAERMKILADVIKKMEEENEDDPSLKDDTHKPPVKAKQQSKKEGTTSDSDLDTSKSKKMHKRKESNKLKVMKRDVEEVDNLQQLDPVSYFKPSAERLSSVSTVPAGKKELDGNKNSLGEGSPVTVQAKISGKTPRRKSTTAAEGSSSKPVTKTPVKTKEKESPKKRKVAAASSSKSDKEENSINEECAGAGALAERLLEDFLKRRSL